MTPEEIIREALPFASPVPEGMPTYMSREQERINATHAALDALVAERDEWKHAAGAEAQLFNECQAALRAVVAERDEWREVARCTEQIRDSGCDCGDDEACAWLRRAEAAEAERDALAARLAEAEREIDFKKKALRNCREAHLAAEARVAALTEALREIAEPMPDVEGDWGSETHDWKRVALRRRDIARAALAAADRPEGATPGERPL